MENLLLAENTRVRSSIRERNKIQSQANVYKNLFRTAVVAGSVLIGLLIAVTVSFVRSMENYNAAVEANASLALELKMANEEIKGLKGEIDELAATKLDYVKLDNAYVKLSAQQDTLVEDNKALSEDYDKLNKEYKQLAERKELFDKYSYAIVDKAGKRTDLSYDEIKTGEELAKKEGLDPNLVFGIIMTESGGNAKATNSASTARGYGQMLKGTGKYVYENIQGHGSGTYNHDMAFDPTTNISLMCSYLGYLKGTGKSAYATMKSYRGLEPTGYINMINSHISRVGSSFSKISANW